jgi:hypothetical protein
LIGRNKSALELVIGFYLGTEVQFTWIIWIPLRSEPSSIAMLPFSRLTGLPVITWQPALPRC